MAITAWGANYLTVEEDVIMAGRALDRTFAAARKASLVYRVYNVSVNLLVAMEGAAVPTGSADVDMASKAAIVNVKGVLLNV